VWEQSVAYGITLLVALGLVLRLSGKVRPRWKPTFGRMVLRQSLPYALLILLMTFYYRTDTLMLERMLPNGALEAGIYAQGFRFFEAFNMLGFLVAGLLLPMFSRMLKQGEAVSPLVMLAFRSVMVGALVVAVFASMHAEEIMQLRYSEHTEQSAPAFAVLMWCFVAVCITYIFGTLLTAGGDLRLLNVMAGIGALVHIGLNLVLIPLWQAEGAAWASLVTQVATALVQLWLAVRTFKLELPLGLVFRVVGYALALVAVVVLMDLVGMALLPAFLLYGVLACALAFGVQLLKLDELSGLPGLVAPKVR